MKTVTFIKTGTVDMFGGLNVRRGQRMRVKDEQLRPLWEAGFINLDEVPPAHVPLPDPFDEEE